MTSTLEKWVPLAEALESVLADVAKKRAQQQQTSEPAADRQ